MKNKILIVLSSIQFFLPEYTLAIDSNIDDFSSDIYLELNIDDNVIKDCGLNISPIEQLILKAFQKTNNRIKKSKILSTSDAVLDLTIHASVIKIGTKPACTLHYHIYLSEPVQTLKRRKLQREINSISWAYSQTNLILADNSGRQQFLSQLNGDFVRLCNELSQ